MYGTICTWSGRSMKHLPGGTKRILTFISGPNIILILMINWRSRFQRECYLSPSALHKPSTSLCPWICVYVYWCIEMLNKCSRMHTMMLFIGMWTQQCIYIYTCVYVHIYSCAYVFVRMFVRVCAWAYKYRYVYIYMYTNKYRCIKRASKSHNKDDRLRFEPLKAITIIMSSRAQIHRILCKPGSQSRSSREVQFIWIEFN